MMTYLPRRDGGVALKKDANCGGVQPNSNCDLGEVNSAVSGDVSHNKSLFCFVLKVLNSNFYQR